MTIILGAVVLLSGFFALMVDVLRRAPEGYQDESGFHFVQRPPASTDHASLQDRSLLEPSRKVA
jgi:hypothetical protein